jgi:hypothetical protein
MRKLFIVSIVFALISTSLLSMKSASASKPVRYASARGEVLVKLKENAKDLLPIGQGNQSETQSHQLLDFAQAVAESAGDVRQENVAEYANASACFAFRNG